MTGCEFLVIMMSLKYINTQTITYVYFSCGDFRFAYFPYVSSFTHHNVLYFRTPHNQTLIIFLILSITKLAFYLNIYERQYI